MITTIAKRFTFDAAHRLDRLPADHKCHRLHGHTYGVEIQLRGTPDANGFLVDYDDIGKAWARLHALLDHRYLNEIPGLEIPSTEALAAWIWERLDRANEFMVGAHKPGEHSLLYRVHVSESSSTWAEVGAGSR